VFTHRNLSLAAVGLLLAAPAAASAQQTAYSTSPVTVKACNVSVSDAPYSAGPYSISAGYGIAHRSLELSFVNTGNVPASKVTFLVNDGGKSQQIEDRGTFTPGIRIDRDLSDVALGNSANCSVAEVDFADGTSWRSGASNVAAR
jgi:hypothetical protein